MNPASRKRQLLNQVDELDKQATDLARQITRCERSGRLDKAVDLRDELRVVLLALREHETELAQIEKVLEATNG